MKDDKLSELEKRVAKLESATTINNKILKSQWELRQKVGKLESRVETIEKHIEFKLNQILVKFEQLSCYKKPS
jgi:uncharacterized FlaG/YvyC family protein